MNPTIASIIEIKRPINLAFVRMSDGTKRFVAKEKLSRELISRYHEEIKGESKDGQA